MTNYEALGTLNLHDCAVLLMQLYCDCYGIESATCQARADCLRDLENWLAEEEDI